MEDIQINNTLILVNATMLIRRILEQGNGAGFTIPEDIAPTEGDNPSDEINLIIMNQLVNKFRGGR